MHIRFRFRLACVWIAFLLCSLIQPAASPADSITTAPSDSPRLAKLRSMLAEHEAVLAGLNTRYKEKHPMVMQVKAEIADLQRAIQEEMQDGLPSKKPAVAQPPLERRSSQTSNAKDDEKIHQSREGMIASPLILKSGLASIQTLLEASDLALAQTLADELAGEFAAASRPVDNPDFKVAVAVINRRLAALVQAIGNSPNAPEEPSANRVARLRRSKALADGLAKLVPDLQRLCEP